MNIFSTTFYGFPLTDWLICLAIAVGTTVILLFPKRIEYGGDIPDIRSPAQERAARKEPPPLPEEDT